MEYLENSLTYQAYKTLRNSVGWNHFAEEQALKSLGNSIARTKHLKYNYEGIEI